MRLDAALFRDLLIVVMNMNNASSQELAEKLIEIYDAQVDLISPTDSKYIKMYISLINDVLNQILCIENNRGAIQGLMHKYLSAPMFMRDKIFKDSVTGVLSDKPTSKQLVDLATKIRATIAWFVAKSNVNSLYSAVNEAATPGSTDLLLRLALARLCSRLSLRLIAAPISAAIQDSNVSFDRAVPPEAMRRTGS